MRDSLMMDAMSRNTALDRLFDGWAPLYGAEAYQFHRDGIIDEGLYDQAIRKVLFIAKEANNPNGGGFDFRSWWQDDLKWRFSHRLEQWAEGVLYDFPPFDDLRGNGTVALRSTAFMNLKKTGGRSSAKFPAVLDTVSRYRQQLLDQIQIIEPEIIVGCVSWWPIWEALFGKDIKKARTTIEDQYVFKWGSAKVIDFYHPSNRYPSSMQYALLSRIVQSERFQNLK